jgi:hypothetical protein
VGDQSRTLCCRRYFFGCARGVVSFYCTRALNVNFFLVHLHIYAHCTHPEKVRPPFHPPGRLVPRALLRTDFALSGRALASTSAHALCALPILLENVQLPSSTTLSSPITCPGPPMLPTAGNTPQMESAPIFDPRLILGIETGIAYLMEDRPSKRS